MAVVAKLRLICSAAEDSRVKASSVIVLAVIVQHMYGRLVESWPSQSTIGERTGLARRTIQYAVKELEQHGYLRITRAQKITNLYRLPEAVFEELQAERSGRTHMRPVRTGVHGGSANGCGSSTHHTAPEFQIRESETMESEMKRSRIAKIMEAKNG